MNHDADEHAECRAEIYRLRANITELRGALLLARTLRQVGGMTMPVKQLVDTIVEVADEALANTGQK